jgi:sulfite dehydrogenase (quinone) subunit SoeA
MASQPVPDLSPQVSDEVRKTTCYMCACRCGINVHMKAGKVAYIEGNRDHPVNKGVLCAKGSAGIMQHLSPARLRAPLRRVGPRGSGQFEEISWEEALQTGYRLAGTLRDTAPEKLAFFTGRDQSQSFTGWWAQAFGTPNWAAHGGFCSVNMAAAGIYTMGGAFWEFGQPDWDRTKLFLLFGVAEDHDSNPIKMGLGKLKARGARVIGVNPIRSGYNAVADDWVGITPGTDGLFILSLAHELLRAGKIDLGYLIRYTNAPYLVNAHDGPEKGLFLRDEDGKPLVRDRRTGQAVAWDSPDIAPDLANGVEIGGVTHLPVFRHLADRYLAPEYAPDAVAARCGIPPRAFAPLPPRLRAWHLKKKSPSTSPGPIFAGQSMTHGGPPRGHACHARGIRPFQRVPDSARAAYAANPDWQCGNSGRVPLQAALSQTARGPSPPPCGPQPRPAAGWPASGLSAGAGTSADP